MLEARLTVDAPAAWAWNLLTDTQAWPRWGTSVRAVRSPTRFIEYGCTGSVQTVLGLWVPFRVTEWEPDRFWGWSVAGVPATGHRVTPAGPAACDVVFSVPGWAAWYLPVCHAALRRIDRLARDTFSAATGAG
jgi:hypothetical protein